MIASYGSAEKIQTQAPRGAHIMTNPNTTNADREKLIAEMRAAKDALEALRRDEEKLRGDLVVALEDLHFAAGRAQHKVETRQWDEAALAYDWDRMRDAEDDLANCISAIQCDEIRIEDMQNDLDDDSIWEAA